MTRSKIKLRTKDRDVLFKKEYSQLKLKVVLNWFELLALSILTFLGTIKLAFILHIDSISISIMLAIGTVILITFLFAYLRKYQLKISRFDKEDIYKKISADLFEKNKH